jgi:hypothetical protein
VTLKPRPQILSFERLPAEDYHPQSRVSHSSRAARSNSGIGFNELIESRWYLIEHRNSLAA